MTNSSSIDLSQSTDIFDTYQMVDTSNQTRNLISPSQIPDLLDYYFKRTPSKPDIAVAIWGAPGIGKTAGARTYAFLNAYRLVILYLQLYDPSDLKGIPVRMDDGSVRWVASSYLPQQITKPLTIHHDDDSVEVSFNLPYAEHLEFSFPELDPVEAEKIKVEVIDPKSKIRITFVPGSLSVYPSRIVIKERALLLLDEISTANPDVQNTALSLVLDKRINEYSMPDCCRILATGNTESDGAFVNPISSALANRFLHIVLEPTVHSFLVYAFANKFKPKVIAFINMFGRDYLHRYNPSTMVDGRYGYSSPRTLEMLSQQYDEDLPDWLNAQTAIGLIGPEAGTKFIGFCAMTESLPKPMDILQGKPYQIPANCSRGSLLLMKNLLVSGMKEIFEAHKDRIHGSKKEERPIRFDSHPQEWVIAQDAFFGFINNHLGPDAGAAAIFLMNKVAMIPAAILSGTEFDKFSTEENVRIFSTILNS